MPCCQSSQAAEEPGERLDSWKEIAAHLRRGTRTAQRWEREQGLPVHRLAHGKLGSVFASRAELDRWWAARTLVTAPPSDGPSLAVLPFADMSPEQDQGSFCEGLAEEIRDALGRVEGLRVASRGASAALPSGPLADARGAWRRLRVGTLLGGSVRRWGDRVRVAVQLEDARSGFQLWAGRYDHQGRDILAVQDEVARVVVRALRVALRLPPPARPVAEQARPRDACPPLLAEASPGRLEDAVHGGRERRSWRDSDREP